jgi:hypothetical protein
MSLRAVAAAAVAAAAVAAAAVAAAGIYFAPACCDAGLADTGMMRGLRCTNNAADYSCGTRAMSFPHLEVHGVRNISIVAQVLFAPMGRRAIPLASA